MAGNDIEQKMDVPCRAIFAKWEAIRCAAASASCRFVRLSGSEIGWGCNG
jgi:hypothetical protein